MAGKTNFTRGGNRSPKKVKRTKSVDTSAYDMSAAIESVKDLKTSPMEIERIKSLQRGATKSGVDNMAGDKLKGEQEARGAYNEGLTLKDYSLFSKALVPKGKVVLRLFKKPIFELNGFLKPDLIKQKGDSGVISYIENRFPYLEAGVVTNGGDSLEGLFGDGNDYQGAIVSLKPNTKLHTYIYFIDKTDISPDNFEGYVIVPTHEIESVLSLKVGESFDSFINELTGLTSNRILDAKITAEQDAMDCNCDNFGGAGCDMCK